MQFPGTSLKFIDHSCCGLSLSEDNTSGLLSI
jgi:hypothetical protein